MAIVTSKEFNQQASAVLKISETEPVYITKWGKVVSVLTSYAHYQAKTKQPTLAEAFSGESTTGTLSDSFEQDFDNELARIRSQSKMQVPDFSE